MFTRAKTRIRAHAIASAMKDASHWHGACKIPGRRERSFISAYVAHTGKHMSNLIASLKSGNWRSLLACFLYFDTGFTVWVLYGPLAPFIGRDVTMSAAQQGFLVAVPVLAAAILRVTLGNLYQS